ncbi:MAG: DNA alkylation repair protein [Candidatus Omnitrophota bacterium]|nr:DNA alkylation repair protein [Candidatus Omnitrophota bacterium]
MSFSKLQKELRKYASKETAKVLQGFFKTGPGEYGEGDIFLGVRVPYIRKIAKHYKSLPLGDIAKLLHSPIHEERLLALLILILQFNQANATDKNKIYNFYLKNSRYINNWDLVDLTAPNIVGEFLIARSKKQLYIFANSDSMWERRISILSTFKFIKNNRFADTLKIAKILISDKEDLIHKAVGWMLREIGKRNKNVEKFFLKEYYKIMPRTMLRYAIEKFPEEERLAYLNHR